MTEVLTYEALKASHDLLLSENAALKDVFGPGEAVVNFLSIALRHTEYDSIDLSDVVLAFKMSLPETPATDAAIAAVRNQGVEAFADSWDAETAKIMEGAFFYPQIERREAVSKAVRQYIAELREAK